MKETEKFCCEQYMLHVTRRTLVPDTFDIYYHVRSVPSAIGTADGMVRHYSLGKRDQCQAILFRLDGNVWTPVKGNVNLTW